HYTLSQGESVVREGDFSPTAPIIDWSSIKSGVYSITVAPVDSSQALPQTVSDIVFYRPSDKTMPTKSDLWVPVSSYSVTNDNTAKILYGTSNANGYILCTLFSADSILSQQWLHVHSGIHTYEVRLPRDMREATLSMATMYDFEQSGSTIHIERADVATSLTIAIDAFRDHITPGQQEHWKIRVTDNTGGATASGVILDMYSKALDALQPHHLGLQFRTGQSSFFRLGWPNASNKETIYCQSKLNRRYNFSVIQPGFNTYRRSFLPQTFYGMRLMKAEARGTADLTVAREHKEEVVVEEAYAAVAYNSAADAGSLSEIAIVNDDAAITGSAEAEATAEPGTSADSYRLPEQPLAFFRP
ncbi:MAG: hypothetical protein K2M65_03250, partial [Muribaculaceae bacterium]|nr:hypothetical protein [Muribaculaceae bacterium]